MRHDTRESEGILKGPGLQTVLELLEKNEILFHEEIHNLVTGRKKVVLFPEDGLDGSWSLSPSLACATLGHPCPCWFITFGNSSSGEWNIARPFGDPRICLDLAREIPYKGEFQILSSENYEGLFSMAEFGRFEELLFRYIDPDPTGISEAKDSLELGDDNLTVRMVEQMPGEALPGFFRGIYLLLNDSIQAVVKTTHSAANTAEVYIETSPSQQGKGFATFLLKSMIKELRLCGKRTIYLVSETNVPSIRIAKKAGLVLHENIFRRSFSK